MASRFETVPEDFLNHLRKSIPGFTIESDKHQFELARMGWIGINKANQHSYFVGAMTFQASDLDKTFGRSNFSAVNARINFFRRTADWSKAQKFTRGFFFSEHVRASITGYLALSPWADTTELLMDDGKAVKTIPPSISSKDKSGVTTRAWIAAKKLSPVKVDLEQLLKLKAELGAACDKWRVSEVAAGASSHPELADFERAIEMIGKVSRMAMTTVGGTSQIAHRYEEAQSGRLYPVGISLASVQTVIKDAALTGNWEYDISNCHFDILRQMASSYGFECPAILNYLEHKELTRNTLATQAGIKPLQAKTCLVALIYGARASEWHKNAIPRVIGPDAAKRLYALKLFKDLAREIEQSRKVILSKWARSPKGWLKNAFGKSISGSSKKAAQMAHLLQGVEAKALQAVINLHPHDIILVQHDGFVSCNQLSADALTDAIATATGYHLNLEERVLSFDAFKYFASRM